MESTPHASSEEELSKLRDEGEISEREYEELLGAMRKSPDNDSHIKLPAEPEFQVFRKRVMIGVFIISFLGIVLGTILDLPYVWVLGIVGMIVVPIKKII